jgi:hypothetical protein
MLCLLIDPFLFICGELVLVLPFQSVLLSSTVLSVCVLLVTFGIFLLDLVQRNFDSLPGVLPACPFF